MIYRPPLRRLLLPIVVALGVACAAPAGQGAPPTSARQSPTPVAAARAVDPFATAEPQPTPKATPQSIATALARTPAGPATTSPVATSRSQAGTATPAVASIPVSEIIPATPVPPVIVKAEGTVAASAGGTVASTSGDLSLTVPRGALGRDEKITVTHFQQPRDQEGRVGGEIVLEPAGTSFSQPASLKIQLPGSVTDASEVTVYSLSSKSKLVPLGSEISAFEPVTAKSFDAGTRTLTVQLNHFSILTWMVEDPLYVVFDFGGQYLKKGDILFALTGNNPEKGGAGWFPGHVGMYLGTGDLLSESNDGKTVIESTPSSEDFDQPIDGPQFTDLQKFKKLPDKKYGLASHIYMGARRPFFSMSAQDRTKVASWAVSIQGKVNYGLVGSAFITSGSLTGGLSCTGLIESAFENGIGKEIVPESRQFLELPIYMYKYTVPVNEAEIKATDTFEMVVTGVVKRPLAERITGNDFSSADRYYTRSVAALPGSDGERALQDKRANFIQQFGTFTFKPRPEDTGKSFSFRFTIDASVAGRGARVGTFTINVNPKERKWVLKSVQAREIMLPAGASKIPPDLLPQSVIQPTAFTCDRKPGALLWSEENDNIKYRSFSAALTWDSPPKEFTLQDGLKVKAKVAFDDKGGGPNAVFRGVWHNLWVWARWQKIGPGAVTRPFDPNAIAIPFDYKPGHHETSGEMKAINVHELQSSSFELVIDAIAQECRLTVTYTYEWGG